MPVCLDILDHWTEVSLEAHWKELVKRTTEVNFTGATLPQDLSTGPTRELEKENLVM